MSRELLQQHADWADFYGGEFDRLTSLLSDNLAEHRRSAPKPAPRPKPYTDWRGLILRACVEMWPTYDDLLELVESKHRKPGIRPQDVLTSTLNILADDGLILMKRGRYSLTSRGHKAAGRSNAA